MRVTSIGGGPGGLYAAILLKRANPTSEITVYERNAPDDTFGFGVVFSAATLAELEDADAPSYNALMAACARWDPVDIHVGGQMIRARGNRFAAISRRRLLLLLQDRCRQLGVKLEFNTDIENPEDFLDADLVLGADGVNSGVRRRFAESFQPWVTVEGGKFIWLGTTKPLDSFTFHFKNSGHGWFQVHAYPYDDHMSTWIVETDEGAWRAAGLDRHEHDPLPPGVSDEASIAHCRELFARELDGHDLVANNSKWLDWQTVRNRRWYHDNVVLLGDAAHTAHFSIGSGTKLAMEDAIALASALERYHDLTEALARYESERQPVVERLQEAAAESLGWFTRYRRYRHFSPPQFAYSLLTRSARVTYDNLKVRDPQLLAAYERWFAQRAGVGREGSPLLVAPPPSATPLGLAGAVLPNRLVIVPEHEHGAGDGVPSGERVEELVQMGQGGAGLLLVEHVAVSPAARINPGSLGLYRDGHQKVWASVVEQMADRSGGRLGLQLVHAGRRGAVRPPDRGTDRPLPPQEAWALVSASPLPYMPISQRPAGLSPEDMRAIIEDFAGAAGMADGAGVGLLEVHLGHGYLLASFLSPLTNQREDGYGGPIEQRMRFPLEVVAAVRRSWPEGKPLSVCLSASDLQRGGISEGDVLTVVSALSEAGVDVFHVVAGQTTPAFRPEYGRGFLAPWADLVRNRGLVPTLVGGNIPTPWAANDLLAAGKADLCIIGKPSLADPEWLVEQQGAR